MSEFNPLKQNPFDIFDTWMNDAKDAEPNNHNAMCLSTVSTNGKPSSRMVLLKNYDETGFVFYTNSNSRKGQELSKNPNVALNFYWKTFQRQVRIEGVIEIVSREMTQTYLIHAFVGHKLHLMPQNNQRHYRIKLFMKNALPN